MAFPILRKGQEARHCWEQRRETAKYGGHQSLGHQPSSALQRRSSSGHSLNDHRLQEAEAHHEVQWDGWLQEVPIEPQVAQARHIFQIGGEVMEGY